MTRTLSSCDRLWINVRLASFDPAVGEPYGLLENQVLGTRGDRIAAILPMEQADLASFPGLVTDAKGALMTPGLIDCHTHLVYGGERTADFERRLSGESYQEISRAGGGILSTVKATRALSEEELIRQARPRLQALVREGVTTLEIKSGYGLNLQDELKMLRAAKALAREFPVRVRNTLLAAHAVPPEYRESPDAYLDLICHELIPRVAQEGLADALDVFCETIAFSLSQAERLFQSAREHGLGIKVHAEQLSTSGSAELAARYGAWSADHLEYLDQAGAQALRRAGTAAVLLPGPYYFLKGKRKPPVQLLRRLGVPMALATDLNPGSFPLASLRLALNLGCTLFGLTPEEALAGATRNAALALGLEDQLGTLAVGKRADLLLWDLKNPARLVCEVGWGTPLQRVVGGEDVHV